MGNKLTKLLGFILCIALGSSFAYAADIHMSSLGRHNSSTSAGGGGDDLFPWPWGSECPFPWQEIQGRYVVRAQKAGGTYNGHFLDITVSDKEDSNLEFLSITEYDRNGVVYASGQGYAQATDRVVKGLLVNEASNREFTVMIRTYVREKSSVCSGANLVTAVTFCPLRGKKCQGETNYLLERM
jgi:hypothetical protein